MAKAEASVEELVGMIERGELRLPEMQRRYVWRSTRVRDLLDSLYRGYPSGAILVWETDDKVPLQEFSIQQQENPYKSTRLLLDGQQRLTSLSAVIRGEPVTVRRRKKPIEILFNLEHPDELSFVTEVEEHGTDNDDDDELTLSDEDADSTSDELQQRFNKMTFVVGSKKLEQYTHWVKVTDVFKSDSDREFLRRAGITNLDDPRHEKYSKRLAKLRAIKKYIYRMDVLERALSYNEVTEIFVRVNSLGAKLRSSDLALAQITAKWHGSLKTFQDFQSQCSEKGFQMDLGVFLKNMIAFATDQSRFLTVGSLTVKELQDAWKNSTEGMLFALNFISSNANIDSPALLSSPYILIVLSYFGYKRNYKISSEEEKRIRFWILAANAKGRYSRGSTETLLDQDLSILNKNGGVNELIDRLRTQVGRLDISPEELEGRNQRSALFKTMFLAFRDAGARDWVSKIEIRLQHSGSQDQLQFHHIFPKALLKKHYSQRQVDDIANLAFIGGKTNRSICAKSPHEYFPAITEHDGIDLLTSQCIPTSQSEILVKEKYLDFLAERRKLISQRLNEFLGTENI